MDAGRGKVLLGLVAAVAVAYAGAFLTIFTNDTSTGADKTGQSVVWGIVIAFFGIVIYILLEVYSAIEKPGPTVEVIEGESALKKRYQEMRNTEGARSIQAIWSAKYPDVEDYFRTEAKDLANNPTLQIERLVNPEVLSPAIRDQLRDLVGSHPNIAVWATDINEFECFLCEYVKGRSTHLKALLVLNEMLGRTPQLGIYIDPERAQHLKPIAFAIQSWFLSLPRTELTGLPATDNVWEINAPAYDRYVTKSDYPFLRTFIDAEEDLLREVVAQFQGPVSIIEVGSGTGRTLLEYAKHPHDSNHVLYLIGVDNSHGMIRVARSTRETLKLSDNGRSTLIFLEGERTQAVSVLHSW